MTSATSHTEIASLKQQALASVDDAFNATQDAISLLRRAGYLAGGVEMSSLTDALQQLRYVSRAL
jgi:hypothetical protein